MVKLQDQLPPFPLPKPSTFWKPNSSNRLSTIYRELSPQPVAAASLGQVYKGRLHSGEEVAVKIQRPNLIPVITLDLALIRWCAGWLAPWLPLNLGHDLTLIVDEFGTKLFEEIDYLNEGRNAEKFATNFRDHPLIKIPVIYWRHSSKRVLTLEWIHGFKLTDTQQIEKNGLDTDTLITIGVTAGLQQLLEHGFFHADPHPGNLFALPPQCPVDGDRSPGKWFQGGRMTFIDFGMMDQLDELTKETLVDAVVHLINKDYVELAGDFVQLGFLTPETDIMPIVPALEAVLGDMMGESVRDFNFKTITDRFSELMYDYPFRVPTKFALIIRSLVTQEGIALSLNPNFKIVDVAYPYVSRRLLTGESPRLRRRLIEVLFKGVRFRWDRLEEMIAIARSDHSFDLLPTAQLGLNYLLSEEGKFLRSQLLLALTEDDRLHTEEVRRLWNLIKEDIEPSQLFNVALGALANFSREGATALIPSMTTFKS
uniref:ABC1 kinase family protein n=1 Tax=Desertifilum tharense IPPAS B-1220 TaxID=1781255 RepID=A0ACD5H1S9_9CYAN